MSKQVCVKCSKEKEIKNGRFCEKGHFVCSSCHSGYGFLGNDHLSKCPVCDRKLR